MKKLLIIILSIWGVAQAQTVGQFRYDTTKFLKVGGRNHVMIENLIATADSTNKPLVVGADGVIKRNSYWPGGGGTGSIEYILQGYGIKIDSAGRLYTVRVDTTAGKIATQWYADSSHNGKYIPLSGTTVANPVTGDIQFTDGTNLKIPNADANGFNAIQFGESGNSINFNDGIFQSGFQVNSRDFLTISGNNPVFRGISGLDDYSPNITDLDYTQKIYVDKVRDSLRGEYIPRAGTLPGYPVTGDIEIINGTTFKINQIDDNSNNRFVSVGGLGTDILGVGFSVAMSAKKPDGSIVSYTGVTQDGFSTLTSEKINGENSTISVTSDKINFNIQDSLGRTLVPYFDQYGLHIDQLGGTDYGQFGIKGNTDFSSHYDSLTYIQKIYSDKNIDTVYRSGDSIRVFRKNGTQLPAIYAPTGAGTGTVTNVSALTLGTTGTDLSSSVANATTTPVITLNVPTASASNRGALSSTDWSTFNNKQSTISVTTPITLTGASVGMVNQGTATTVLHGNAAGNPSFSAVGLTTDVTGVLPVANGGTNLSTYTTGDIIYASATNTLSKLPIGTSAQRIAVVGGVPVWRDTAAASGGSGWALTGNAGTTAGTNFIGTTDNQNLVFKRNNVQSALIDSSIALSGKTFFGFGAGASAASLNNVTAFGYKALALNSGGSGSNTAIGNMAAYSNTTQTDNTAVGWTALYSNNSAGSNSNTAVGSAALYTTTNGSGNQTAVGSYALNANTYGGGNTAIGANALRYITNYSANIAIGVSAGAQYAGPSNMTAATSSIFIGNTTLAAGNAQSNQIVMAGGGATGLGSNTTAIGNSSTLTSKMYGILAGGSGSAVASAAAIVANGNVFHVTGTTTITSITATNVVAGATITIIFDGILTFTDGSNLKLAGNFTTAADATITLAYDGTNFYEITRSTN